MVDTQNTSLGLERQKNIKIPEYLSGFVLPYSNKNPKSIESKQQQVCPEPSKTGQVVSRGVKLSIVAKLALLT